MAIKYLSHIETLNINMQQNELLNAVIHNVTTAGRPASPLDGQIIFNSSLSKLEFWNGTAWDSGATITEVIAGDGLSGGGTSGAVTLTANVDDTTVEINSDTIRAKTAAVANGGNALATGDQIYDFVIGLGYTTATGTVTSVGVSGNDGISVSNSPITTSGVITLGLTDGSIANAKLANSTVTIGSTSIALGATSTSLAGLTGLDFTAANASIAASIGANDLTIGGSSSTVIIPGDLTVNGTTTTINSNEVNIGDAIIKLNSDETGTPSQNAGLEIERGTSTNVFFLWDETEEQWTFGSSYDVLARKFIGDLDGNATTASTLEVARDISLSGDVTGTVSFDGSSNVSISTTISANSVALGADTTGNYVASIGASNGVAATGTGEGAAVSITGVNASETAVGVVELATQAEVDAGADTTRVVTPATLSSNLSAQSYSTDIGGSSSVVVTHNLGTRDVIVQVYSNSTYESVYMDVERTTTNTVTFSTAVVMAADAYRVLITKA